MKTEKEVVVGKEVIGVGTGAVILNEQGEVLMSLRGPKAKSERGKWELPGGTVEFGETMAEALKREVEEELGIEIVVGEFLNLTDQVLVEEEQHWISATYICRIMKGQPTIIEPEKCQELRWVALEDILKLDLTIATYKDILALIARW